MSNINNLVLEATKPKSLGTEETKNFNVEKFRKPAVKTMQKENGKPMYRSKVVYKKDTGEKRVITFAVKKNKGPEGGSTQVVNIKRERIDS